MGRNDKRIADDAPARELGAFLRSLRRDSGLTFRKIGKAGFVCPSSLSQNCDGRLRHWPSTQTWLQAFYQATRHHGIAMELPAETAEHFARHLWKIANARQQQGPHRPVEAAGNGNDGARSYRAEYRPAEESNTIASRVLHGAPLRARSLSNSKQSRGRSPLEVAGFQVVPLDPRGCQWCDREAVAQGVVEQFDLLRLLSGPPTAPDVAAAQPGRTAATVYHVLTRSDPVDREFLVRILLNWLQDES